MDLVLNDASPSMGESWISDAYKQNELVIYSLKIATKFLKLGGVFVTKVFRSDDYNSIM